MYVGRGPPAGMAGASCHPLSLLLYLNGYWRALFVWWLRRGWHADEVQSWEIKARMGCRQRMFDVMETELFFLDMG